MTGKTFCLSKNPQYKPEFSNSITTSLIWTALLIVNICDKFKKLWLILKKLTGAQLFFEFWKFQTKFQVLVRESQRKSRFNIFDHNNGFSVFLSIFFKKERAGRSLCFNKVASLKPPT